MWHLKCALRKDSPVSLSTWDTNLLLELSMRFVLQWTGDKDNSDKVFKVE